MPGKIYFRDGEITVTSAEVVVGQKIFPVSEIVSARAIRRRPLLPLVPLPQLSSFALLITTAAGEQEVWRGRNGYVVFQMEKAIEGALRDAKKENPVFLNFASPQSPVAADISEAVGDSLNCLSEQTKIAS